MDLLTAIEMGFSRFSDFKGRSNRPEFWYWTLFIVLAELTLSWLVDFTFVGTVFNDIVGDDWFIILPSLLGLVMIVPNVAISFRRLHDSGKSGWNFLWIFLPFIGWVILIIYYCRPSDPRKNLYGKPSRLS